MSNMPVPYVALRSEERDSATHPVGLNFSWERGFDVPGRDRRGVLWYPYGNTMEGEPNFGQIHSLRQAYCMETPACQVCGEPITSKWIPWIVTHGASENDDFLEGVRNMDVFETYDAPTCKSCQEAAEKFCPAVSRASLKFEVKKYSIVGVRGDIYTSEQPETAVLYFSDPNTRKLLRFFLAKQLLVRLERYREPRE